MLWEIRGKVRGKGWGTQKKNLEEKKRRQINHFLQLSVLALTDCEWRAATPGLNLLRARFPGERAETGGADQWVLKRRELPGFARVNKVTSASFGYPLSVFNKTSTLKRTLLREDSVTSLKVTLCLSYRVGGHHGLGARYLVVWEIDCGDWLTRGFMPDHQHVNCCTHQQGHPQN